MSTFHTSSVSLERLRGRDRKWPVQGYTRAPYWAYTDPDVYAIEQDRIFRGRAWHYVGLEVEVPEPGQDDFHR